jgi:ABC-type multidrug transport system fused ATPase/permease subunit
MQHTLFSKIKKINKDTGRNILNSTKWIYRYAGRYRKAMLFYTLTGLTETGASLGVSLVSKDLVDIITGHQSGMLIQAFCWFIGLSVGHIILSQLSGYFSSLISIRVDNEIKSDIFHKILITDWESITSYHTGDLLTRWNSDASVVSNGILNWIPNLIINIVKFISSFAIIMYYDPSFALIAVTGIPFSILLSRSILLRMQNNSNESSTMYAKMAGFHQEAFSNIQIIKAFDLIRLYTKRLRQLQREYLEMRMGFQRLSMLTSILMSMVGIAVSYACYGWGIYRVWSDAISYGTMTLFLGLTSSLTGTLNALISQVPTAISITTSAGRLMDILNMPKEEDTQEDSSYELPETYREKGISLRLTGLNYAYRTGTRVFEQAVLEAHPHDIVALVGPSGEGKTTLLRILLALLKPQEGDCRLYAGDNMIDSIPVSPSTRKLFAYVPQGNTMFSGTIAENLRNVKPDASEEEMIASLRAACAWEFVEKLPDRIHSKVGERGTGFSEGQSQRLSIARALLRKSPILLLDEATSALDVATERKVLRNIMRDEYPRTCIITTHRPTVLGICSKVYTISEHKCRLISEDELAAMLQEF